MELRSHQELRLGKSGDDPYLHNTDVGLVYKGFADWLDVGLNFKKEFEKDGSGASGSGTVFEEETSASFPAEFSVDCS